MKPEILASLGAVVAIGSLLSPPIAGQSPGSVTTMRPAAKTKVGGTFRTPWGDPDLQGIWTNHDGVPLERPKEYGLRPTLTDAEVAAIEQRNRDRDSARPTGQVGSYGEVFRERLPRANRTSVIIDPPDGRLPPMTAEGKKLLLNGRADESLLSWEGRDVSERCITRGLPGAMIAAFYNHNYHILQTPEYVAILIEMYHDARIIPLDSRPRPSDRIAQWLGIPRGHWEGDTLVVETTNFNGRTHTRDNFAFGTAVGGRITERYRRVDETTIDYRYTVDDPATFTKSWTAYSPFTRLPDSTHLYEYACHEGNYAMANILRGARKQEADAAKAKSEQK